VLGGDFIWLVGWVFLFVCLFCFVFCLFVCLFSYINLRKTRSLITNFERRNVTEGEEVFKREELQGDLKLCLFAYYQWAVVKTAF